MKIILNCIIQSKGAAFYIHEYMYMVYFKKNVVP